MSELTNISVTCAECGAPMQLRDSRYGKFWGCTRYPLCKGAHGAHPDGRPLGIPANKETKEARIRAHAFFDYSWKVRGFTRSEAYQWLSHLMALAPEDAHIGKFSKDQCEQLIQLLAE